MFCQSCGSKIDDGFKFCQKCGAAVNSAFSQTVPITPQAVPVQQITTGTSITENMGKNKLIHTAAIVAIAMVLISIVAIHIVFLVGLKKDGQIRAKLLAEGADQEIFDLIMGTTPDYIEIVLPVVVSGVLVSIPIVLSFFGWKKNSRTMVLIAGIIYVCLFFGIPSGIMCFIAFSKMKKPA